MFEKWASWINIIMMMMMMMMMIIIIIIIIISIFFNNKKSLFNIHKKDLCTVLYLKKL